LDYVLEVFSLLVVLATIILFVFFLISAPQIVPIHYNIYGVADKFGSKATLIILPVFSIITYVGLSILNRFPYIFNFPVKVTEQNHLFLYKMATRMIRWIKFLVCLIFADIVRQETRTFKYNEYAINNISIFIILTCIMLCLTYYIVKMSRINSNK
jgi:hypothetical protein